MKAFILTTALCVAPLTTAIAQTCSKQSPPHTVALLELYTSEGCNSCPPADKFVSGLRSGTTEAGLSPDQIVPLSLHVDYWDGIGWKDVFSKHAYTERQRRHSDLAHTRTIYTPEVFVAGQELLNWSGGLPATVKRENARPAKADIGIALGKISGGSLPVEVSATSALRGHLFIAFFENGLVSEVKAGENRGATLRHDYVVRELIGPLDVPMDPKNAKALFSRTFAVPVGAAAKNLGVAAFVQSDSGEVLQALALPVCND